MGWLLFILFTGVVQLLLLRLTVPLGFGHSYEEQWGLYLRMAAMSAALLLAAVILFALRRHLKKFKGWWLIAIIIWILPAIATAIVDGFDSRWPSFEPLFIFTLVVPIFATVVPFVLLIPAFSELESTLKYRRGFLVLFYVEQAVRMNLPLPEWLQAAGRSEKSILGLNLQRLSLSLKEGKSLESALATVPEIKPSEVAMIGAAERVGRLPEVLAYSRARFEQSLNAGLSQIGTIYVGPTLIFGSVSTLLLTVFVFPKFEKLFEDFGIPLPVATRAIVELARSVVHTQGRLVDLPDGYWVTLVILFVVSLCLIDPAIKFIRRHAWLVTDRLPIVGKWIQDRAWADAMFLVSQAIKAGEPLHRAIGLAAELRSSGVVSRAMRVWARGLENGTPSHIAAATARVPDIIGQMQLTAHLSSQPSEVFEFLARHYALKWSRLREVLRQSVGPMFVIAMGLIVLWVGLAIFEPLVAMMYRVMETSWTLTGETVL